MWLTMIERKPLLGSVAAPLAYCLCPFLGVVQWSFTLPEPGLGQYGVLVTDPLVQLGVHPHLPHLRLRHRLLGGGRLCDRLRLGAGTPTQRLIAEFCILMPFWISVLTRAFGWVALLSNRGLINTWLQSAGRASPSR